MDAGQGKSGGAKVKIGGYPLVIWASLSIIIKFLIFAGADAPQFFSNNMVELAQQLIHPFSRWVIFDFQLGKLDALILGLVLLAFYLGVWIVSLFLTHFMND